MGPKIDPKWKKNGVKKQSDFETKLAARTPDIGPRTLPRQPPLAAPPYAHALFPKQSGQDEEVRTKREEGRREERKKGRRGKKDKREENHVGDLTRQGPEARRIFPFNIFEIFLYLLG